MSGDRTWARSLLLLSSVLQAEARQAPLRWQWRQLASTDLLGTTVISCRQLASGKLEMRLAMQGVDVTAWVPRRRELERALGLAGWGRTDNASDGALVSLYAEPQDELSDAGRRDQLRRAARAKALDPAREAQCERAREATGG